jgi:hypothetical protein
MSDRLLRVLRELRRSERGMALPMALIITVVAMGFASVPVVASINAQNGDSHNQGTNEALAAAEAGAELAVLRQSELLTDSPAGAIGSCVAPTTLNGAGGSEAGWCTKFPSAATREPIGNAQYAYQVRPCYADGVSSCAGLSTSEACTSTENGLLVQVVSTGYATVGGREVTKRIEMTGCAQKVANPVVIEKEKEIIELETKKISNEHTRTTFESSKTQHETELAHLREELIQKEATLRKLETEPAGVEWTELPGETIRETVKTAPPNVWADGEIVGVEGLNMNNNAQVYNGGAGSNKEVKLSGSANVCGTVHYGTNLTKDTSTSSKPPEPKVCAAGRPEVKGEMTYPQLTLPGNIASENSDYRLCNESICHAGLDPVTAGTWQRENIVYNPSNKQLTVKYNALTLEGTAPYYLCQLILQGGANLYSGSGKSIKIYFAPPSSCPGINGSPQLQIANGAYIYADAASGPQFLFVGSTSKPSESLIELAGGAKAEQFVIYAPYSKIVANNGIEVTGAIIGNTLELAGGASLNKYGTFTPPPSESFLPSTETVVEKEGPKTKVSHPSKAIEILKTEITTIKTEISEVVKEIAEDQNSITTITKTIESEEETITNTRNELETLRRELGGGAKALEKKSFTECTTEPPAAGLAPDEGCSA